MTPPDVLAALISGSTSIALGLRSGLLKKDIPCKPTAPRFVTVALMISAAGFGGASFNIWAGAHASWREVFAYTGSAVACWALLINVALQKRGVPLPPGA
jgi:hypothetical protein